MTERARAGTAGGGRRSLVEELAAELRRAIREGTIAVGAKLPSEAALTQTHAVSRTVVREAIAALRSEGLVAPRQGSGVFVTPEAEAPAAPFGRFDPEKLSDLVEMMEFRIGVEGEAAALAAARRAPAQEAKIAETLEALDRAAARGQATAALDLRFHMAVAEAAQNARFTAFLEMLGQGAIPRARLARDRDMDRDVTASHYDDLAAEHRRIAEAIAAQDPEEARRAMQAHLRRGLQRYRDQRQLP